MKQKFISLGLALAMLLGVAGCNITTPRYRRHHRRCRDPGRHLPAGPVQCLQYHRQPGGLCHRRERRRYRRGAERRGHRHHQRRGGHHRRRRLHQPPDHGFHRVLCRRREAVRRAGRHAGGRRHRRGSQQRQLDVGVKRRPVPGQRHRPVHAGDLSSQRRQGPGLYAGAVRPGRPAAGDRRRVRGLYPQRLPVHREHHPAHGGLRELSVRLQ